MAAGQMKSKTASDTDGCGSWQCVSDSGCVDVDVSAVQPDVSMCDKFSHAHT